LLPARGGVSPGVESGESGTFTSTDETASWVFTRVRDVETDRPPKVSFGVANKDAAWLEAGFAHLHRTVARMSHCSAFCIDF
jgi:hypothetical protein